MTSDSSLIERQMAEVELRPFTLDEFHHRRHRKQRNRRIASAVMGLALAGIAIGGALQVIGVDDEKVDSDILGPLPSPFAGTWTSTDTDGSTQTMVIQHTDGDEHGVELHDDAATACSGAPATLTGTGRLTSITELVIPAPVVTCDDGSIAMAPDGQPLAEVLEESTFVHDPQTDTLLDDFGVLWHRPGAVPDEAFDGRPVLDGPSQFEGSWVGAGGDWPETMEISRTGDGDVHEVFVFNDSDPRCAGGPTTMIGTGRRGVDGTRDPGVVSLVLSTALTCNDGTTPVPQSPEEEGMLADFPLTLIHDPVTDEVVGSLGALWWREGTERKQGQPMATVDKVVEAVDARDTNAFLDLFAPDGMFDARGYFTDSNIGNTARPLADLVQAWMASNDAWDFEADVISCTTDPVEPVLFGRATDGWIECEVASRWPTLSLEITERWRFELRGERLVYWQPVPLVLDPSERAMPLGFAGLEAWETWLAANHPEDAARWLNPSADGSVEGAEDRSEAVRLEWAAGETRDTWKIDGIGFRPTRLVPYDPAFADAIQASIDEYLEER